MPSFTVPAGKTARLVLPAGTTISYEEDGGGGGGNAQPSRGIDLLVVEVLPRTVRVRLYTPSAGQVRYGAFRGERQPQPSELVGRGVEDVSAGDTVLTTYGLQPGTDYTFAASVNGGGVVTLNFRTP